MCNGNCNQGRNCNCAKDEINTIGIRWLIVAVVLFWWGFVELFTK